jgi:hypothetical protein
MIFFLLVLLWLLPSEAGVLTNGNKFSTFFWTAEKTTDTVKYGCYAYAHIAGVETNKYRTVFWLNYSWWEQLFLSPYMLFSITSNNGKPVAITRTQKHYDSTEWLTGFKRIGTNDSIKFYFPLLPVSSNYGRYDYFTVNVNDTADLEFYGAGDSVMVGTFVHKLPGPTGSVNILARNAIIVELTKSNPFRIKSLRFDATKLDLIKSYLTYDLTIFKKNVAWYGVDVIDNHVKIKGKGMGFSH